LRRLDRLRLVVPAEKWPPARTGALRVIDALHRTELIHVHFGYVVGDVYDYVRHSGHPLVLSLHGSDATELPQRQPGHYAEATGLVDAVIVPSRFLADVAARLGFPHDRIHVIPAGVDNAEFRPSPVPEPPVVAFVGRLVEKKGIDVLLRAWPSVVNAVPEARLDIVGAGPLAESIPAAHPSVRHLAPQPARRVAQVRDLLQAARVVVTPSRTAASGDAESLLLVNLEAQASGRPVVTTRHGGIPEFVVDGESALVVEENDAAGLAAALVRVLSDDVLARRLGAAGPAVAARFDVGHGTAQVDALYDELLARRRGL
jgi:glycosyltransferase involved in cell wall biosynthesis